MNSITCIDCGVELTGNMSTGKLVKKHNWVHVSKGRFRCPFCDKFIKDTLVQDTHHKGGLNGN